MSPRLRQRRLRRLLKVLQHPDTAAHFHMDKWVGRNSCGTTACVLGHAAFDPLLRKQGLKVEAPLDGSRFEPKTLDEVKYIFGTRIIFKRLRNEAAGTEFFGLTCAESEFLFMPAYYPSDEPHRHLNIAIQRVEWLLDGLRPSDFPGLNGGCCRELHHLEAQEPSL